MADQSQGNELEPIRPASIVRQGNRSVVPLSSSTNDVAQVRRPEDEYPQIQAELAALANRKPHAEERTLLAATQRPSLLATLLLTFLHLGFALGGFLYLNLVAAVLWFFFLLVAYPILLAFLVRAETLGNRDLITLYKAGLSQVPVIGKILAPTLTSKKND